MHVPFTFWRTSWLLKVQVEKVDVRTLVFSNIGILSLIQLWGHPAHFNKLCLYFHLVQKTSNFTFGFLFRPMGCLETWYLVYGNLFVIDFVNFQSKHCQLLYQQKMGLFRIKRDLQSGTKRWGKTTGKSWRQGRGIFF